MGLSNHLCSAIRLVLREPSSLEKNLCTEVQVGGDWVQVRPGVRDIDPLQDIETIIHLPCEQVVAELPCLRSPGDKRLQNHVHGKEERGQWIDNIAASAYSEIIGWAKK